jgi:hypothetical protein
MASRGWRETCLCELHWGVPTRECQEARSLGRVCALPHAPVATRCTTTTLYAETSALLSELSATERGTSKPKTGTVGASSTRSTTRRWSTLNRCGGGSALLGDHCVCDGVVVVGADVALANTATGKCSAYNVCTWGLSPEEVRRSVKGAQTSLCVQLACAHPSAAAVGVGFCMQCAQCMLHRTGLHTPWLSMQCAVTAVCAWCLVQ